MRPTRSSVSRWRRSSTSVPDHNPGRGGAGRCRERSPFDLVRHASIVFWERAGSGPAFLDSDRSKKRCTPLPRVEDPLVRTGFTVTFSYALGIQAKYEAAHEVAALRCLADVDAFDLEFARPHAHWNLAFACLGLRRFGEAERHLQLVEDSVKQRHHGHHALNARVLRARMLLQLAQPEEARPRPLRHP